MQQKINIAIDGSTASGKTSVGKLLAEKLQYQFIDSGLFYRYLGYNHSDFDSIDDIIEIFDRLKNNNLLNEINSIEQLNEQNYLFSGEKAAELAKNDDLRRAINSIIKEITKEKGFVVVGRDVTTNILPDAEIKILLSANLETRVNRRAQQLSLSEFTNIYMDILNRDVSSNLLLNDARKVSKVIDTTYFELSEVVDMILTEAFKKIFKIRYIKYFRIIVIIIFLIIIKSLLLNLNKLQIF
jgi:cytidylate kinase